MRKRDPDAADTRTESQSAYLREHVAAPHEAQGDSMKNTHQQDRVAAGRQTPPSGRNDDDSHALQAGKDGPTQRKSRHGQESSTRDAGSDDRRSGSERSR